MRGFLKGVIFKLGWALFLWTGAVFADEIKDIKPPVYFKPNYILLIILVSLIFAALVIFLIIFFIRKIRKGKEQILIRIRPAHEKAYEALEKLRQKNLPAQGRVKEYYFELSYIVRTYMEERFHIRAPEMTTEEFLFSLKSSSLLSGSHKNLLKEFLNLCDIVKFAKYGPTEQEMENSFSAANKLVDETKKVEEDQEEKLNAI
ncbi:MAG: hypothetical protein ABH836_04725 [Candidatus Omnitrophota bacterium]